MRERDTREDAPHAPQDAPGADAGGGDERRARHFLPADELVDLVAGQPGQNPARARALLLQVTQKNYSPPKRERILQWQAQQDFPICPTPDDPASCNVYRELQFPDDVYQEIEEFWEEQAEGEDA